MSANKTNINAFIALDCVQRSEEEIKKSHESRMARECGKHGRSIWDIKKIFYWTQISMTSQLCMDGSENEQTSWNNRAEEEEVVTP